MTVSNRGAVRYVFTSSHTSRGFYTYIPDLVNSIGQVYILKGAPGSGKSTFVRLLGEMLVEQGYDVEFWISAVEAVTPEGVYIPQLDAAIVNGSLPQPVDPRYPGSHHLVNLEDYWDEERLKAYKAEVMELVDDIEDSSQQAYFYLKEASRVKERIRNIYSSRLNLGKVEELLKNISTEIMENAVQEKHYFAGAVTPEGMVNYLDELSSSCKKRYIFKGPSGSGKSIILNGLAQEARKRGYCLEYFHCGLEADYLAMIIIPNLQLALIEAGNGEIAARPWDVVIDMTACLDNYDGEQLECQTSEHRRAFEALLLQAQQSLEAVSSKTKVMKKIFTPAMDFTALDHKRQEVLEEIRRGE